MKKISVVIPCYNEEENVAPMCRAITDLFSGPLEGYDYEVIFADNCSKDKTREEILKICNENKKVKAIFNEQNFGQFNSPYYAMLQSSGDCTILLAADFQDPPELIPTFVKEWEEGGYSVVCGIKTASKENGLMYFLRGCYYKLINAMSNIEQIQQFTGFGLYDKRFIAIMRSLDDPTPFLRSIVAEYASNRKEIPYEQPKRRSGKTSNNFFSLYDAAMLSLTSYTKMGIRLAVFLGFIIAGLSFLCGLGFLVAKLINWDGFVAGYAPIIISVFFIGGVQLAFLGFIGEYIMSMNTRIMKRPLVIEARRINFEEDNESK